MKHRRKLNTPWRLHFDRDGTEDVAIICNRYGDLATSCHFWLPEDDDPIPATLASFWLMVQAPELLESLQLLLKHTVERKVKRGLPLTKAEDAARSKALDVIAKVNRGRLRYEP